MKKLLPLLLLCCPLLTLAQTVTRIGSIQGSGAAAAAGSYTIEAVVTGVYPGLSPAGFYVQEETAAADGNPATSDALFVVQAAPTVAVGDKVRISGTVQENAVSPSYSQAVLTSPAITVLSTGNARPAFTLLPTASFVVAANEAYEGMLVQFDAPLTVADVRYLKSRGELTLSAAGVLYQPTQFVDPNDSPASGTSSSGASNVAAIYAAAVANTSKSITLDDGSNGANPSPTPCLDAATGTVRVGSTVAALRAIMGYGYGQFRLQPLAGADAPQLRVVRPAVPTFSAIDVKLASFNVLNYFNGDGAGGGFPTSRGAATLADFNRQRSKILVALARMNADVVGLIEIENDGTGASSALQDLVNGLNQALGAGIYALVNDGATRQPNNTDLIHCAIIYKPAAVRPLGGPLLPGTTGIFERPPLAQLFITNQAVADTFALVVNHFKSKGSGSGVNADQQDGQGPSNDRRRQQALGLVQFINATVVPAGARRVVSVGDYNAHFEEDPLDILRAAGLVVSGSANSSSYVFNGLSGSLDHAVLTPNLLGHVAVEKWHINASEPEFLEYDFAGAATDVNSPFRSSDHDPLLIGLSFRTTVTGTARIGRAAGLLVYPNPAPGFFQFELANAPTGSLTLELVSAQGQRVLSLQGPAGQLQAELSRRSPQLAPGIYLLQLSGPGIRHSQRVVKQ
jgi:predicted extracellular nuclease